MIQSRHSDKKSRRANALHGGSGKFDLIVAAAAVHAQQTDDIQEDVDEVQIQGQCAIDGSLLGQLSVACIVGVDLAELLGIIGGEQHETTRPMPQ